MARKPEAPVLLVRWYDHTKWLLERVDSFPKNQRFIFGTRLADTTLDIMELLIEASYTHHKASLLHRANVKLEQLRWLTRLAKDRKVITPRQYEYSAEQLTECGKMLGGWLRNRACSLNRSPQPLLEPFSVCPWRPHGCDSRVH